MSSDEPANGTPEFIPSRIMNEYVSYAFRRVVDRFSQTAVQADPRFVVPSHRYSVMALASVSCVASVTDRERCSVPVVHLYYRVLTVV